MFASKCEGFAAFDNAKTESLKLINCEFNSHASFRGTCSGSTNGLKGLRSKKMQTSQGLGHMKVQSSMTHYSQEEHISIQHY